mgnify:CR=1 FL=1|jgi:hypothetical protein
MSQFNIYARKLDTVFKEARSEYNTAFRALQEAQQAAVTLTHGSPETAPRKSRLEQPAQR